MIRSKFFYFQCGKNHFRNNVPYEKFLEILSHENEVDKEYANTLFQRGMNAVQSEKSGGGLSPSVEALYQGLFGIL